MPVYYVYHDLSAFTLEQKQSIADGIADAHVAATNAPHFFVKVVFVSRFYGDLFSNGIIAPEMIQVVGNIRSGRDSEHRYKLLTLLDEVIARHAGDRKFLVEITLVERPAQIRLCSTLLAVKLSARVLECAVGGHERARNWISGRGSLQKSWPCSGGHEVHQPSKTMKAQRVICLLGYVQTRVPEYWWTVNHRSRDVEPDFLFLSINIT